MCGVTAGNDVRSESAAQQPWAVAGERVPRCRWGTTGCYYGGQQPLLWDPPACAGARWSTADSSSEAETAISRGGFKICYIPQLHLQMQYTQNRCVCSTERHVMKSCLLFQKAGCLAISFVAFCGKQQKKDTKPAVDSNHAEV